MFWFAAWHLFSCLIDLFFILHDRDAKFTSAFNQVFAVSNSRRMRNGFERARDRPSQWLHTALYSWVNR